jgi:hypothetical protein
MITGGPKMCRNLMLVAEMKYGQVRRRRRSLLSLGLDRLATAFLPFVDFAVMAAELCGTGVFSGQ